jgi:aspartate/methionine/tyrosine aminotransferase
MARFAPNEIIGLVGNAPRYDLAESLGPDLALSELLEGSAMPSLALSYGTASGDLALRTAIASRHQGAQPDDVVVTAGGMHALFLLAFLLCERDTEAVAATPLFPLARNALQAVGANIRTWSLAFDDAYQPDVGRLCGLLSPATRLVSLATPQNPSGVAVRPELLREIVGCVAERAPAAWVLVDETYREAVYGDHLPSASAVALGPKVVSVASLSKCHGAPGLRIGWAIVRDADLRAQLVTAKFNTIISCSPLDEALALQVLRQSDRIIGERRGRLANNLERVSQWVEQHADSIEWVRPDAGALCCVRLRLSAFDDSSVQRFYAALQHREVRVAPGLWFGETARVFRLGFGLPDEGTLPSALERVGYAMRDARS